MKVQKSQILKGKRCLHFMFQTAHGVYLKIRFAELCKFLDLRFRKFKYIELEKWLRVHDVLLVQVREKSVGYPG